MKAFKHQYQIGDWVEVVSGNPWNYPPPVGTVGQISYIFGQTANVGEYEMRCEDMAGPYHRVFENQLQATLDPYQAAVAMLGEDYFA